MCDSLVKRSDYLTLTPLTYLLVSLEIVARHKVRSDWLVETCVGWPSDQARFLAWRS
jgi:hypothetical protein